MKIVLEVFGWTKMWQTNQTIETPAIHNANSPGHVQNWDLWKRRPEITQVVNRMKEGVKLVNHSNHTMIDYCCLYQRTLTKWTTKNLATCLFCFLPIISMMLN